MEGNKPIVRDVVSSPQGSNNVVISNCRLRSSYGQGNYQLPKEITYLMDERPSYQQIGTYLRDMEIKGFGEGAVVARRFAASYRWKFPSQWGIILLARKHASLNFPYAPYNVSWFDDKMPENEPAWAEDLIVIHACMDENYLKDIVEAQGVEVDHEYV